MSILLLFSSNQRPLYEQDILDVLAAPERSKYDFRYERRYVDQSALDQWSNLGATPVLVFFSIQQEAFYQPPAYIPVRRGRVLSARIEGDICFVQFELGPIISLPSPLVEGDRRIYEDPVRRLAEVVSRLPSPGFARRESRKSASLVDDAAVPIQRVDTIPVFDPSGPILVESNDQVGAFSRATDYLSRTTSFRSAQFLCFHRLTDRRSGASVMATDGVFPLVDRSDYELELLQMQPREVLTRVRFRVGSAEEVIKVIGVPEFDIASRYDLVKLPLHVPPLLPELRETILTVAPKLADTTGPRLHLRLRITRQPSTLSAFGAAFLLLLAGLPGAFGDIPKMAVVSLGALIAFVFFYYGWVRISSPRG